SEVITIPVNYRSNVAPALQPALNRLRAGSTSYKIHPSESPLSDFQQIGFPLARVDGLLRIIDSRLVDEDSALGHEPLRFFVRRREAGRNDDFRQKLRLLRRGQRFLVDFARRLSLAEHAAKFFVCSQSGIRAVTLRDDESC